VETPPPISVRILTVCTGNICRSPVAERLLQAGLDQVLPGGFRVRSAGTMAMVGHPIQPLSAEIIARYGGNPEPFAARQLTAKILRDTDLVLTMSTEHRGEVLKLDPSLLKRTFTIREFARMLDVLEESEDRGERRDREDLERDGGRQREAGTPSYVTNQLPNDNRLLAHNQSWRNLPARAASVRHLALAPDPADNDVVDPYRRDAGYYHRMEDELAPAVLAILRYARINAAPRLQGVQPEA
jgi:protein-tyrosine phosphatase